MAPRLVPTNPMLFDLPTLIALRVAADALMAVAFLAQARRYPTLGGPAWWSVAALLSIVGTIGLATRGVWPDALSIPLSNTGYAASFAAMWLGWRAHNSLPLVSGRVAAALAAVAAVHTAFVLVWDVMIVRQLLFAFSTLAFQLLTLRDMRALTIHRQPPEVRVITLLTLAEAAGIAGYVVAVVVAQVTLPVAAPVLMFYFLLTALIRVAGYNALVAYRLRQEAERARQRLAAREADSRALIENLSAGVMVFRPDSSLSSVNSAARRFLGWGEAGANPALPQPIGRDRGWRLMREDGQPMRRHDMPFERVLATGQPVQDVIAGVAVGPQRQVRWALCNAYPETDAQGALRHVVLSFIDITSLREAQSQQKALQAHLAQSQKMEALGTLAGGVAHDFNNILAAILGNTDLARQDLSPGHPAGQSLDEIRTAARRGRELVRQILAFSRQQPLERTTVQLADTLAESCALLRAALPPTVELVQSVEGAVPPVLGDATQLGQVLLNLGTNALHALQGRQGRITLRLDTRPAGDPAWPPELARTGAGAVRLRVSDDGCGMDEAVRARIFEPFFTTKPVGQGTGLGLPVVLGIVQVHGGAIEVDSAPGAGTTFTLWFPAHGPVALEGDIRHAGGGIASPAAADAPTIAERPPAAAAPAAMTDATAAAPHVLYLDDDDTLVFLVRRLLERRGYRVTGFTSQRDAIEAVRAQPQAYQLLLTDYNMPGQSGLDVAREVLDINPALTVAVASGYITDELQAQARTAGVREVVFKTDAVEQFCEVVARLVQPA